MICPSEGSYCLRLYKAWYPTWGMWRPSIWCKIQTPCWLPNHVTKRVHASPLFSLISSLLAMHRLHARSLRTWLEQLWWTCASLLASSPQFAAWSSWLCPWGPLQGCRWNPCTSSCTDWRFGKQDFFYGYVLLLHALKELESPCPLLQRKFPENPVMIIVYPTQGLEEEMVLG